MRRALVVCLLAAGCSRSSPRSAPEPAPTTASGSAAVAPTGSPTGSATRSSYTGPADRGPCQSAHDCKLRDVCGCSCEGVLVTAPSDVACEEACKGDGCTGYTVMCDLPTQICGAIPKAP